ncbi:MCE family protein [Mycobacterium sp. SM3041]|uniref:MlaD family protein n=1 Tax=Mycobacterium sp. SM3041 TaxID=3114291 RepID=UPI003204BC6C
MPNSFDHDGHSPSNRSLFIIGACFALVAALSAGLAIAKSKGDLDRTVRVSAALVDVGDGLPEKSDVKFRGVLVGQVADVVAAPSGQPNTVHLNLNPEYAQDIPNTVTARVVPSNVFAVSSVQLLDNQGLGGRLQSGAVIPEDTSLPTILFQTTLNKFRRVFNALSRQSTDHSVGVLEAISEAARGKGQTIRTAGGDLNRIVAQLNTIVANPGTPSTVSALSDAATALRSVSPDLFDALDAAVQPMRTFADKRTALGNFLTAGLNTVGTVGDAFDHQADRLITITTELTPVVGVLADNGSQFHPVAGRLQHLAENMLQVYNPDTTQFTVKAIISLTPTRTYVRADCPRYGALAGPSCQNAPETPTAPGLYPALGSMGLPPPAGVTENRPNIAPPRDSVRHDGEVPDAAPPDSAPLPAEIPVPPNSPTPTPAEEPGGSGTQSTVIGGNVGPVGSTQEKQQLGQILGHNADTASVLLLGPVVRGATVKLGQPNSGVR